MSGMFVGSDSGFEVWQIEYEKDLLGPGLTDFRLTRVLKLRDFLSFSLCRTPGGNARYGTNLDRIDTVRASGLHQS